MVLKSGYATSPAPRKKFVSRYKLTQNGKVKEIICKYFTPISITAYSFPTSRNMKVGANIQITDIVIIQMKKAILKLALTPSCVRFNCFAPTFWPTKTLSAVPKLTAGIVKMLSIL